MGTASLVLGIIALVISLGLGPAGFTSSFPGILGIIFGAIALKDSNEKQRNYGKAGLILSLIALAMGIIVTVACVGCASILGLFGFMVAS